MVLWEGVGTRLGEASGIEDKKPGFGDPALKESYRENLLYYMDAQPVNKMLLAY